MFSETRSRLAFLAGLLISVAVGVGYNQFFKHDGHSHDHDYYTSTEVHTHSDFVIIINDERIDLSDDKYMSVAGDAVHPDLHLHDNNQDVLHRHAADLTFADFLASINFTLTEDCLTTDTGAEYCTDDENSLILMVNEQPVSDMLTYVPADEDRILLYYGSGTTETLRYFFETVSDEACIYSYTCPWRGTPPPEACGLTCEI